MVQDTVLPASAPLLPILHLALEYRAPLLHPCHLTMLVLVLSVRRREALVIIGRNRSSSRISGSSGRWSVWILRGSRRRHRPTPIGWSPGSRDERPCDGRGLSWAFFSRLILTFVASFSLVRQISHLLEYVQQRDEKHALTLACFELSLASSRSSSHVDFVVHIAVLERRRSRACVG